MLIEPAARYVGELSPAGFHYPPVDPGIPALPCGAQALVIDRDLPMIAERYDKPQLGSRPFHTVVDRDTCDGAIHREKQNKQPTCFPKRLQI
jgi:hypothetical protein